MQRNGDLSALAVRCGNAEINSGVQQVVLAKIRIADIRVGDGDHVAAPPADDAFQPILVQRIDIRAAALPGQKEPQCAQHNAQNASAGSSFEETSISVTQAKPTIMMMEIPV